jgi:cation:H+ antiporter
LALDTLMLACGLALLLGGGEALVRGASALARALGISPLVIGLTVVAFGTSAPELAVNVMAAIRGNAGISFGNIVGSNMANIGLIVAGAAIFRPLDIKSVVLLRELPMMMLATRVALVLTLDLSLGGRDVRQWDRADGLVLLLVFTVFLYYTANELMRQRRRATLLPEPPGGGVPAAVDVEEVEIEPIPPTPPTAANLGLVAAGIVALLVGAQLTVDGAVGLARALGVPEVVIGLTVIAVGTSLPELAASVIAALRGQADLAVGNVVGSNIFNLLLVGGVCATARPIPIPEGGVVDLSVTLGLSLLLWAVAATRGQQIIRVEGALLLVVYLAYVIQRTLY